MTLLATEDFAGSGALSGNWTAISGHSMSVRLLGKAVPPGNGTAYAQAYTGVGAVANDQGCRIKIDLFTGDDGNGLLLRGSTVADTYAQCFYFGSDWYIEIIVAGSVVNSASSAGTNSPSTNDIMDFYVVGNVYRMDIGGSMQVTLTDSNISSGTPGFVEYTNNVSAGGALDDFEMYDFAGGGGGSILRQMMSNH